MGTVCPGGSDIIAGVGRPATGIAANRGLGAWQDGGREYGGRTAETRKLMGAGTKEDD